MQIIRSRTYSRERRQRVLIQERVMAGLTRAKAQGKILGRPKVGGKIENAIRARLRAGEGMLKVAKALGVGTGTLQRINAEMATAAAD
jgi:DNA invertase Pin-like site-specific DNA recombinase